MVAPNRWPQFAATVSLLVAAASATAQDVRAIPRDVDELLETLRAVRELYLTGFRISYVVYGTGYPMGRPTMTGGNPSSPDKVLWSESTEEVTLWLDKPRILTRAAILYRSYKGTRRLLEQYASDGIRDRWLRAPLDDDPELQALANVAPAGTLSDNYFNLLLPDLRISYLEELKELTSRIRISGPRNIGGIRSIVLEALRGSEPYRGEGQHYEMIFAIDRNYICWQHSTHWWYQEDDGSWPISSYRSEVRDWLEFEPGLWFPAITWSVGWSPPPGPAGRERWGDYWVWKCRRLVRVERLLEPLSSEQLAVKFPPGTIVYELDQNGDIVNSWEVRTTSRPLVGPHPWRLWLGLAVLCATLALILFYARHRARA